MKSLILGFLFLGCTSVFAQQYQYQQAQTQQNYTYQNPYNGQNQTSQRQCYYQNMGDGTTQMVCQGN